MLDALDGRAGAGLPEPSGRCRSRPSPLRYLARADDPGRPGARGPHRSAGAVAADCSTGSASASTPERNMSGPCTGSSSTDAPRRAPGVAVDARRPGDRGRVRELRAGVGRRRRPRPCAPRRRPSPRGQPGPRATGRRCWPPSPTRSRRPATSSTSRCGRPASRDRCSPTASCRSVSTTCASSPVRRGRSTGPGPGMLTSGYTSLLITPAARRRGRHRAVELPVHHGHLEARTRPRGGQHDGAQAGAGARPPRRSGSPSSRSRRGCPPGVLNVVTGRQRGRRRARRAPAGRHGARSPAPPAPAGR